MTSARVPVRIQLNGQVTDLQVRMNESLLDSLRQAGCKSLKKVCETADCGACSVLVDGRVIDSCITLSLQCNESTVETLEALEGRELHPLQRAFVEYGAVQCGFCIPGMVLTLKNLLDTNPSASLAEIREVMTLCRCTGYVKPIEAVLAYQSTLPGAQPAVAHGSAAAGSGSGRGKDDAKGSDAT